VSGELVPLRIGFDVTWFGGYRRDQVKHTVRALEREIAILVVDRDSTLARADRLAGELEAARTENVRLRQRIDRICRTPITVDAAEERLRHMVSLAHAEADEITGRARALAQRSWSTARVAQAGLRRRVGWLVEEMETRRRETEAAHGELMDQARAHVSSVIRDAEERRRELDDEAAAHRERVRADFELAMRTRRAEAGRELLEAQARATRMVRDASRRVEILHEHRDHVADVLLSVQALLARASDHLVETPTRVISRR
jgi:colicin import membrane protein